jgi:hypothetical protein
MGMDFPLPSALKEEVDPKWLRCLPYTYHSYTDTDMMCVHRYLVHSNTSFRSSDNYFLHSFLNTIHPSYDLPSASVCSHTLLDAEALHIYVEELKHVKASKYQTMLYDRWEDKQRRSIYECVTVEPNTSPVILGLDDMTGTRGTADGYLKLTRKYLKWMDITDGQNIIVLTTNNPTVRQAF